MRYIIGVGCLSLIVLRMVRPSLAFDQLSLELLIVAILVLLLPNIQDLLSRIRKFKKGDIELEFGEQISALIGETREVERAIEENPQPGEEYSGVPREATQRLAEAASDPRGALLVIGVEIESRIRDLARQVGMAKTQAGLPITRLVRMLAREGAIREEAVPVLMDFWAMRNRVAHQAHYQIEPGRLYELAELGLTILRLLPIALTKNG